MIKFLQKHKLHFLATLLSVFMCMSFGVFSVYAPKVAFAEDEVEYYPAPEELMEYATNVGYETDIEHFEREIEEVYSDYVDYDGEHLTFYSEDAPEVFDNHEEVIAMISANIDAMNELVDEGVGYIDENWEFQPTISDDYITRATQWSFQLKWNRAVATFGGNFAIITSLLFLTVQTFLSIEEFSLQWGLDCLGDEDFLQDMLDSSLQDDVSQVGSRLGHLIGESTVDNILLIVNTFRTLLSNSNLYLKMIKIIMSLLLPTISDCTIVLHSALFFDRGAQLTACWIPTRSHRWGVSLKVDER